VPHFRFTAIDSGGQLRSGVMEAPDAASVIDRLHRDGNIPVRTKLAGRSGGVAGTLSADLFRRRGLSRDDIALVLRELATMLTAGQDVDRALRFIVETAPNKRLEGVMEAVRNKVRGGSSLHQALAEPPANFPRLHIGLVRAGEAGGTLGDTLVRLADMMDRERDLVRTVRSALIYPSILTIAAIVSVFLLIGYVLPQFEPLFRETGARMPTLPRMLMSVGDFVTAAWPYMVITILLLALLVRRLLRDRRIRLPVDRMLLHSPIAGALLRDSGAARFCRMLGTLVANGVPLIGALGIIQQTIGNLAVTDAIEAAITSAKSGAGLARTLEAKRVFPNRATHLLRLGEENAQLAQMALKAADIHEERSRQTVQRLVALLVPVITILMGGLVATIVGSLILAMLSLNDLAG
jgi:general secretion pathway protein F